MKRRALQIIFTGIMISSFDIFGQFNDTMFYISKTALIPEQVLKEIKRQVENEILYYKMIANPEIRKDSFMIKYSDGTTLTESPYNIIFNPPFRNTNYKMIVGVKRWGIGNYALRNFYLITKKGNRFTNNDFTYVRIENNVRNWPEISPFSDTLQYDLWSKSYPFDTRFIVYFNPTNNKLYPVGGDMELYPVNWNEWLPDMDIRQIISLIVEMRLDKFGILKRNNELTGIHPLASSNEFWNDSDALDSINAVSEKNMSKANYDFYGYVPEGLRITNGFPVLVRVPIVNNYISGEMEITYYQPEINVQDCSVRWKEIKYYIYNEPENYEATQPKIRILTEETVFQIKKTPYRIFLESQFFFNDLIDCQIEIDAGDI